MTHRLWIFPLRVRARLRATLLALVTIVLPAFQTSAQSVQVDPVDPALTTTFATEWNTAADFESWTRTGWTSTTATGTTLSGTSSGTTPSITRSGIVSGPDLDLGYNDFVDVRVSIPAAFTGTMVLSFGVANAGVAAQTGIVTAREVVVANSALVKDGALHTYRFDMALVPMWRGILNDLRVTLRAAAAGQVFAFDFIRVGDLSNDTYLANTTDQPVTTYELSSKHFRFIWDANRATNNGINATIARGCLRNAEEVWAVYVKKLGYIEPSQSMNLPARNGSKYKVNFLCTFDGYWMGGSPTSFGYLNIDPSGLQVDTPSWVIPHEGMHVFQMHQGGGMPGHFWESHANYGRERWLEHYSVLFPSTSNLEGMALTDSQLIMNSGRSYYLTWPLYLYLDKNPDGFPDLGEGVSATLWKQNASGTFPYATIETLTPQTSVKDILGCYARRMATLDFTGRQAAMQAAAGASLAAAQTELVRVSDDASWWRVPSEKAPAMGGYAIHPIVPTGSGAGRVVTVNFRGLTDSVRGADWRASLVVVDDSGVARYSSLWNAGTNSVTLAANENTVYLSVAATPDTFPFTENDDLAYPYRSHPGKQRMHYEVQITGATPRETSAGTSGLVQHANGGGWKASTATVNASAYLGPNARVYDFAQVLGTARIEDFGIVRDTAIVRDSAIVSGHSTVSESATIRDTARVRDWAKVYGTAVVSGNARVMQRAQVSGSATLTDTACARGTAILWDGALTGGATVDGDLMGGPSFANGCAFGHAPYVGVPAEWIRPAPDRIAAAYTFAAANDSCAFDSHGALTAFARGAPAWTAADAKRSGFLTFNGSNQWLLLDRSLADTQAFTFTAWVKPLGGVANQAVLWMGASTTRRMVFTPDDGTGHAKFSIRNGGPDQTLTAATALPLGVWSHVAITLDGTTAALYLNGSSVASGAVAIRADALLGANDNGSVQHHYLARAEASAQPMFTGALDGVEFYTKALTAAEVAAMQPATSPFSAGTLHVDLRATDASAGTATWANNGTLGNFTRTGAPSKVANVLSTGIAGVQFSGSGQAYTGPNTVADIDGGSDRTVEVWAFNPALAAEETTVSWGHRGDVLRDFAFNFGNHPNWGAAAHWGDDVGWGTPPTAAAWHHLTYTYAANVVRVFIDGVQATTKTLGGPLDTWPGEPLNIACQRDTANGARSLYFSGYLNTVRVHGGVLTDAQIVANAALGPAGKPANATPTLAAIADQIVDFGTASIAIPLTVGDPDTALAAITLSGSSANGALLPASAISFTGTTATRTATLTPTVGATGTTAITLTASDGATLATRTFNLTLLTRTETWRRQYFGTIANTGTAADLFDANNDGESNLLEFATGQNPNAATLTQPALVRNGATLEFTYTRSLAAMSDGVTFVVEWSDTLLNDWSITGVSAPTVLSDNGITQQIKVTVPAGVGVTKRFMHLKVTRP